jgi:hypothetical protein
MNTGIKERDNSDPQTFDSEVIQIVMGKEV